jgi:hypothetical protein
MGKTIKHPQKAYTKMVAIAEFDKMPIDWVRGTIDQVFDSLKEDAIRSLFMEGRKKHFDGVCIRAWIVPMDKTPLKETTP